MTVRHGTELVCGVL